MREQRYLNYFLFLSRYWTSLLHFKDGNIVMYHINHKMTLDMYDKKQVFAILFYGENKVKLQKTLFSTKTLFVKC